MNFSLIFERIFESPSVIFDSTYTANIKSFTKAENICCSVLKNVFALLISPKYLLQIQWKSATL